MKKMLILAVLIAGVVSAADLITLKNSYDAGIEGINIKAQMEALEVTKSYVKDLDDLREDIQKEGDLEKVQAVIFELDRMTWDSSVPAIAPPEQLEEITEIQQDCIKKVSSINRAKAKKVLSLSKKQDKALEKLQKKLTKSGKIEEAVQVQDERKALEVSKELVVAKAIMERPKGVESAATNPAPSDEITIVQVVDLKKGLLLHYNFDFAINNKIDDSGITKSHGIINGTPLKAKGVDGSAFQFDGIKDYVKVERNKRLSKVLSGDYTLSAWFNPVTLPRQNIGGTHGSILVVPGHHAGLFYRKTGEVELSHWFYEDPANKKGNCLNSSTRAGTFLPGEWCHVAGVASVEEKVFRLYVNGELVKSNEWTAAWAPRDYTERWYIGMAAPWDDEHRGGLAATIDEVRVYERALSAAEVSEIYQLHSPR